MFSMTEAEALSFFNKSSLLVRCDDVARKLSAAFQKFLNENTEEHPDGEFCGCHCQYAHTVWVFYVLFCADV